MESNKIVVQFKDGKILKGSTGDFSPNKKNFHVSYDDKVEVVDLEKAKAIFFVKDIVGNKNYDYQYDDTIPSAGKKVAVDFNDGETIIGYVLSYSPHREGFIMTPADIEGNNERIYIVRSALKNVRFLNEDKKVESSGTKKFSSPSKGEKRENFRAETVNLISYECLDEDNSPLDRSMGRTLDISQGGLLIETKTPIEAKYILLMAMDTKDELIKIKGEVIYSREKESNIFHTGVRFIEADENIRRIILEMIKVFVATKTRIDG